MTLGRMAVCIIAGAGAACSFDLDAVPPPGPRDRPTVQIVEVGPGDQGRPGDSRVDRPADRPRDKQAPDTRAPDLFPPDTRAPDTRPPDTGPPPPPPQNCDQLFGGAPGYQICEEKQGSCRFYVQTNNASCHATCGKYGVKCLGAQNNVTYTECSVDIFDSITCSTQNYTDQICECSKP
jgi:hypothetical protein